MSTSMRRIVAADYEELSQVGADQVAAVIAARPAATLLIATGNTPMGLYRELARRRASGRLGASGVRVFQLDEYLGLGPSDHRSLYDWSRRAFVAPLGIPVDQLTRLPAAAADPDAACRAYDAAIAGAGGIDLAILGLGPNGHLGFNEPPSGPDAPTRIVDLTAESLESNGRYWNGPDQVPRRAMTVGMNVLLAARRILLVVSGQHKHQILKRSVDESPTPEVPASFLQFAPDVTILADRDAWGATTRRG